MKPCTICFLAILTVILLSGCAERQNPTSGNALALLSQTPVRGQAMGVAVAHDTIFVSDRGYGVSVYTLTDPSHPQLVDSIIFAYPEQMSWLAVDSTATLGATEGPSGIEVFNLRQDYPNNHLLGFGSQFNTKFQMYYDGQVLKTYRTDRNAPGDGFFALYFNNTGTPEAPVFGSATFSAHFMSQSPAWGFALNLTNNRVYDATEFSGFYTLDLNHVFTNPDSIKVVGQLNTPGLTHDAALTGNILCLASGYQGLVTVDVSNDSLPVILGSLLFYNSHNIERVIALGTRAYVLDKYDAVYAVDISNPAAPQMIGNLSVSTAIDFTIYGNLVVIADVDAGLVIGQIMY